MDKRTNLNLSGRKHARVIIVGAGPAGIGAAVALAGKGVRPVVLIDRVSNVGGMPALCMKKPGAVPTFVSWLTGGRWLVSNSSPVSKLAWQKPTWRSGSTVWLLRYTLPNGGSSW
jgi:cation diffusion facilitator CzcD-associated flavoprotein CzcO